MNKKITTSLVASFLLATTQLQANDEYQLSTITVSSATKTEQSIKDVTSNINVITKEEIEEKKFTTVLEALNSVAGISFSSNGGMGSSSSLNLRGSDNNRVLILIDGIKYKEHSSINGTDIAHIMIHNIERIEIIKGAQSGIWGADASAGVINIITKKASLGTHGNALVEYGSFNTKKYEALVSHGSELFDFSLSASKLDTNSFTTVAPKGEDIKQYEDDAYKNRTINAKANLYLNDNSKLGFNIIDIDAFKEYDSSSTKPNDTTNKKDMQSRLYSFYYNLILGQHDLMIKYDQSKIENDYFGVTYDKNAVYTQSKSTSVEISDTFSYNEKDFLIVGMGKTEDKINYVQLNKNVNDGQNKAKNIYLTNSNVFEKLILTQSLRYDSFDNFNNKTTGKIGAKYNINNDFSILSNYGTSYSVPALMQNLNPWGATNMDLKPEESKNFDIGFVYKNLSVTYFDQRIENLIEWTGTWPNETYDNLDGVNTIKGFEIEYKKDIYEDTLLSLSYTRLSAKDKNDEYLQKRAKENLKFGLDYYGFSKWHVNINGEYVGNRVEYTYGTYDVDAETGNYTLWNGVINYEISKNLNAYVKLDNITDKYYQTVDGYATAPRSAYIGLKASF